MSTCLHHGAILEWWSRVARLRHRFRIGRILVHGDGARVHRARLRQRPAEEPLCRLSVAFGRKQEVDGLAAAIDGSTHLGRRRQGIAALGAIVRRSPDKLVEALTTSTTRTVSWSYR